MHDCVEKDYLIDKVMTSIASFAAAARMSKKKVDNLISQPGVSDMTTEEVLLYLIDFIEKESNNSFELYDKTFGEKIEKDTVYIELIPEAPFNPELREETIEQIKKISNGKFALIQVLDEKNKPKFVTIEEFNLNYYKYWEPFLHKFNYTKEQIENFKK